MKKIKVFMFLFLILLLSGCSVEYDLTLNDDLTVNEKVVATEKTKRMESYTRQKDKQAINYLFDMYKRPNEDISITSRENNSDTIAVALTQHDSIEDYASKFKSDIFDEVKITKDNDVITFKAVQSNLLSSDGTSNLLYDDVKINISIPFEVVKNNADSVSKNTYTWNINKSSEYKTIEFSYKENIKKDKINVSVNNKVYNINYGVVIAVSIVIIIGAIVLFVYIKNKKNNVV